MKKDIVYLGSAPPEEECCQVGSAGYETLVEKQCEKYINRIREVVGNEPAGAKLKIMWQNRELGRYAEVVCEFDVDNKRAYDYAFRCESDGPLPWTED